MAEGVGEIKNNRLAYAYTMPALAVMALVVFYPFVYNVIISFSNMNLTHFRDWRLTGFGNYLQVIGDQSFCKPDA